MLGRSRALTSLVLFSSLFSIAPSLLVPVPQSSSPPHTLGRRAAVTSIGAGAALLATAHFPAAALAAGSPITEVDAFQLKATYNGLSDALQNWGTEIALVQLSQEPQSVVAVAGLTDSQLKHFAESSSENSASVAAFRKRRDELLNFLFLARGAARYEKDPNVARDFIAKAKVAAEGATSELATIAASAGIEIKRAAASAPPPEVTFTPKEPSSEGGVRLTL